MVTEKLQSGQRKTSPLHRLYRWLARRAYTVIILGALFCTLAVKFFYAVRNSAISLYPSWITDDIAVLLAIELILAAACFLKPKKLVFRTAVFIAALVCTWSVMNAAWLIRTGTQILPTVLFPLFRDPLNTLGIVGINLIKMPTAAVILLAPSAVALAFFFYVLAKAPLPCYSRKRFVNRAFISLAIIFVALLARAVVKTTGSARIISYSLRYNCQLKAITIFLSDTSRLAKHDLQKANRQIPFFDQLQINLSSQSRVNHNIVIVVLEGVQYRHTSLYDRRADLTPYLASLADQGAEFTNFRSSLTHTTKALFSLFTGHFPSASQDIVEAVPARKPYASLATILKQKMNFSTAFFQSAKGNFEARPGLVYNLGFDKFWARDNLNDTDAFLGYLGSDEFEMLKPITKWIARQNSPFLITVLCSVTHDPYVIPQWFGETAKEPVERYQQTISYTDQFIAALDVALAGMNLRDKTIFCVVGDHGEAFGEHGLYGHERIAFEENLRIPCVVRAPGLIRSGTKINQPTSSIDLTPTLLALMGFDTDAADFDGLNALQPIIPDRKVYFTGWMWQGPAGFVKENQKFIFSPTNQTVSVYDLSADPLELDEMLLPEKQAQQIAEQVIDWRKSTIFNLDRYSPGQKTLFQSWLCRWNDRVASAKYLPKTKN